MPALFVEAASNANEHIYALRDQLRRHREFLINKDLKSIARAIYLDVIDSVKQLAGKALAHPSLEMLSDTGKMARSTPISYPYDRYQWSYDLTVTY